MRVMRPLTRDERVEANVRRLTNQRASPSRDDAHGANPIRPSRNDMWHRAHYLGQDRSELVTGEVTCTTNADRRAAVVPERLDRLKIQRSAQKDVVPEFLVAVEWGVGGVEGDVVMNQRRQPSIEASGDGLQALPEQAVVDDQHGPRLAGRGVDSNLTRVDGGDDGIDRPTVGNLQAVDRRGGIRDGPHLQEVVEIRDDVSERGCHR